MKVKADRKPRNQVFGPFFVRHSCGGFFFLTSTLLPITPPSTPPTTAPMTPPFTLSFDVVAPMIAPAAAPMAASRLVFFCVTVPLDVDTLPPLDVVTVPPELEELDVRRRVVDEDVRDAVRVPLERTVDRGAAVPPAPVRLFPSAAPSVSCGYGET